MGRKILLYLGVAILMAIISIEIRAENNMKMRQMPTEEWNVTFGGSNYDWGIDVEQTADGYIVVGTTGSFGGIKAWLIKVDENGNEEWNKTFGNTTYGANVEVVNGGYIIVGSSFYAWDDYYVVKTDENGNMEWQKIFDLGVYEIGCDIEQTLDGGYIIIGFSFYEIHSCAWLIKIDENGNEEWNKTWGWWAEGRAVEETLDGGYIIVGTTSPSHWEEDIWLIKTNSSGIMEWDRTFGGENNDTGHSVEQTSDGGYIISGYKNYRYGYNTSDLWLIKVDENGNEEWNKTFGGNKNEYDWFSCSAKPTTDGGYIVVGTTESFGAGSGDAWLIKLSQYPLWRVRNMNTGETYWNISDAIEEAGENHTIDCYGWYGPFFENIVINKPLKIYGHNNASIIGSPEFDVIYINSSWVTIGNFTIWAGNYTNNTLQPSGIKLDNAYNCRIENSIINLSKVWLTYGIKIIVFGNHSSNEIVNCNLCNNVYGIYMWSYCHDNKIMNCNIYDNTYGIYMGSYCINNYIENNSIHNNTYGIKIAGASNNYIKNCSINENEYGIYLENSTYNIIENCILPFNFKGIYLEYSCNNSIRNCDIIGIIWRSIDGGILLNHSSYNIIEKCSICLYEYGIKLYLYSNYNVIRNCITFWNIFDGINISLSLNNEIEKSKIHANGIGIIIHGFNVSMPSYNNAIKDCFIYNNDYGIMLFYSHNNTITNISNHTKIFSNNYDGIYLYFSSNTIINNSVIYNNGRNGILLNYSFNNNISTNRIKFNLYGITLNFSNDNLVYNNFFENTINAKDNGYNIWNVSKKAGPNILGDPWIAGNYWHDYTGNDINGDGIGDTELPYNCSHRILHGGDWAPLVPLEEHINFLLRHGWNYITLPVENDLNVSDIFNLIQFCQIILIWNESEQRFYIYVPGCPYDFDIEDGKGYFIAVSLDTIFEIKGIPIESVNIHLLVGWNSLGWFNENEINASILFSKIHKCIILLGWNPIEQNFVLYIPGAPDFVIERGDGFLVAVSEESYWNGDP